MIELSLCSRNFDENIVEFASEYHINSLTSKVLTCFLQRDYRHEKAVIVQALFAANYF